MVSECETLFGSENCNGFLRISATNPDLWKKTRNWSSSTLQLLSVFSIFLLSNLPDFSTFKAFQHLHNIQKTSHLIKTSLQRQDQRRPRRFQKRFKRRFPFISQIHLEQSQFKALAIAHESAIARCGRSVYRLPHHPLCSATSISVVVLLYQAKYIRVGIKNWIVTDCDGILTRLELNQKPAYSHWLTLQVVAVY